MKKNRMFVLCMSVALAILSGSTNVVNAQMEHMFVYPNNVGMTDLSTTAAPTFSITPSSLGTSDAAYDEHGNVLFYIVG